MAAKPSDVDIDQAIVRAVAEELRRARAATRWSRPELVNHMRSRIPVNTYACYEQAIRQCSIPRLVEICQTLGVSAPALLGLALQRLELGLVETGVWIDLRKIICDEREEVHPLRQWARHRIEHDAFNADSQEPAVVRLQWIVVKEMAFFCGVSIRGMLDYVREFTPESTPREHG